MLIAVDTLLFLASDENILLVIAGVFPARGALSSERDMGYCCAISVELSYNAEKQVPIRCAAIVLF
ncbi:MAG: hypothetical protein FWD72_05150, partial [Eggerthellaceae bacterium]|nr:hypothetical protein [Eggerthellaceae bacterium]